MIRLTREELDARTFQLGEDAYIRGYNTQMDDIVFMNILKSLNEAERPHALHMWSDGWLQGFITHHHI